MSVDIKLNRTNFWTIAINSTAAYVLSFLIVFYIDYFIKIAIASSYKYNIGFNWGSISYYIEPHQWTHDSVSLIFSGHASFLC